MLCWGHNVYGELGLGDDLSRGTSPAEMGPHLPAVDLGTDVGAVQVVSGCALLRGGAVKCWGANGLGVLGLGDATSRGGSPGSMGNNLPAVDLGTGVTASWLTNSSGGALNYCALVAYGGVKCWGMGQGLGDATNQTRGDAPGTMGDQLPILDFGIGRTAVALAGNSSFNSSYSHACAILDDGSVSCWGMEMYGELGPLAFRRIPGWPIDLGTGRTAVQVAVGVFHICALLDDGSVKCWGSHVSLGLGDMLDRGAMLNQMGDALPPVDLGTGVHAVQISAGEAHTCALLSNGAIKCWGANSSGQLGLGDKLDRGYMPNQMGDQLPAVDIGGGQVSQIAAGAAHNCAVLSNGGLKCWGTNGWGQLGLGDSTTRGDQPNQMGSRLPLVSLPSLSPVPTAPDAGVVDAGPHDAGVVTPLSDIFDPSRMYVAELTPSGFVVFDVDSPATPVAGFPHDIDFRYAVIHPQTGRLIYQAARTELREFHCDVCFLNHWPTIATPANPTFNDPLIPTPRCRTATNAIETFGLTPDGKLRYSCNSGGNYYDDAGNAVNAPPPMALSFGANGLVLGRDNLWDATGKVVSFVGLSQFYGGVLAGRPSGAGFHAVWVDSRTNKLSLWSVDASGQATSLGNYGDLPTGFSPWPIKAHVGSSDELYAFYISYTQYGGTPALYKLSLNAPTVPVSIPYDTYDVFSGP